MSVYWKECLLDIEKSKMKKNVYNRNLGLYICVYIHISI